MVREPLCDEGTASRALITLLRFIEPNQSDWLSTNVTRVGSPDRAECDILGVILGVFWPIQATIVVGQPRSDFEVPS